MKFAPKFLSIAILAQLQYYTQATSSTQSLKMRNKLLQIYKLQKKGSRTQLLRSSSIRKKRKSEIPQKTLTVFSGVFYLDPFIRVSGCSPEQRDARSTLGLVPELTATLYLSNLVVTEEFCQKKKDPQFKLLARVLIENP